MDIGAAEFAITLILVQQSIRYFLPMFISVAWQMGACFLVPGSFRGIPCFSDPGSLYCIPQPGAALTLHHQHIITHENARYVVLFGGLGFWLASQQPDTLPVVTGSLVPAVVFINLFMSPVVRVAMGKKLSADSITFDAVSAVSLLGGLRIALDNFSI